MAAKSSPNHSLEHARHNQSALKHLDKSPQFLDWVITMCFYSSLHFVKSKIFPLTLKTNKDESFKIENFDAYARFKKADRVSKHEMLLDLVKLKCPAIATDYNQLMDMCWTARYSDYTADRELSNLAKEKQKAISLYCDPPVPKV